MRFLSFGVSIVTAIILASLTSADDTTLATGDAAPAFTATALDGNEVNLDTYKDAEVIVLVFTCNSCPVAQAYEDRLIALTDKFKEKNVKVVAINNHGGEDVDAMKARAKDQGFTFDYVYDGSGKSAKDYGAEVTPHCFIIDKDRKLVYQGGFDNKQADPTEHYVADAVDATLNGKVILVSTTKAFGCGIKFKK